MIFVSSIPPKIFSLPVRFNIYKNLSYTRRHVFLTSLNGFCSIDGGEVKVVDGELSKSLLENNKCYLLDCGAEVFVWVGRVTQVEERKAAIQVAEVRHCAKISSN